MEIEYKHQLKPSNNRLEKKREKEKRLKLMERDRELFRIQELEAKIKAKQDIIHAREKRLQKAKEIKDL